MNGQPPMIPVRISPTTVDDIEQALQAVVGHHVSLLELLIITKTEAGVHPLIPAKMPLDDAYTLLCDALHSISCPGCEDCR